MAKRTTDARPAPVPVNVVCSLCGEAWGLHREENGEVSTLECIRLLKAKSQRPTYIPQPYPAFPRYPAYPYWQGGQIISQTTTGSYTINGTGTNCNTPTVALASAAA
jgi:hypothetical protein